MLAPAWAFAQPPQPDAALAFPLKVAAGAELRATGLFEVKAHTESLGDGAPGDQHAVVAQDENPVLPQVGGEAPAFIDVIGDALETVVSNFFMEQLRVLGQWQQTALEHGHRHARLGVMMNDT